MENMAQTEIRRIEDYSFKLFRKKRNEVDDSLRDIEKQARKNKEVQLKRDKKAHKLFSKYETTKKELIKYADLNEYDLDIHTRSSEKIYISEYKDLKETKERKNKCMYNLGRINDRISRLLIRKDYQKVMIAVEELENFKVGK